MKYFEVHLQDKEGHALFLLSPFKSAGASCYMHRVRQYAKEIENFHIFYPHDVCSWFIGKTNIQCPVEFISTSSSRCHEGGLHHYQVVQIRIQLQMSCWRTIFEQIVCCVHIEKHDGLLVEYAKV